MSYPTLTVRTQYDGAAPAEIENLLTKPQLAQKLVLGLDARDGCLAVSGWTDQTAQSATELAQCR